LFIGRIAKERSFTIKKGKLDTFYPGFVVILPAFLSIGLEIYYNDPYQTGHSAWFLLTISYRQPQRCSSLQAAGPPERLFYLISRKEVK
jgi:hypothetical protein